MRLILSLSDNMTTIFVDTKATVNNKTQPRIPRHNGTSSLNLFIVLLKLHNFHNPVYDGLTFAMKCG